jgi:hypothetical protein
MMKKINWPKLLFVLYIFAVAVMGVVALGKVGPLEGGWRNGCFWFRCRSVAAGRRLHRSGGGRPGPIVGWRWRSGIAGDVDGGIVDLVWLRGWLNK